MDDGLLYSRSFVNHLPAAQSHAREGRRFDGASDLVSVFGLWEPAGRQWWTDEGPVCQVRSARAFPARSFFVPGSAPPS